MFDAEDGDDTRHYGAHKIGATRPAEDCGCHNETRMVPLKKEQF
jgi:hypothetical protein